MHTGWSGLPSAPRRTWVLVAALMVLAASCGADDGAVVVSPEDAADTAVDHVAKSISLPWPESVVVVPQPLPSGTRVEMTRPVGVDQAAFTIRLGAATWLAWLCDPAGTTRVVLIDRASGAVRMEEAGSWPLVDGEAPWVVAGRYPSRQSQVWNNLEIIPMHPDAARAQVADGERPVASGLMFSSAAEGTGRTLAVLVNGWKAGEKLEDALAHNIEQVDDVLRRMLVETETFDTTPSLHNLQRRVDEVARTLGVGDTFIVYLVGHGGDEGGGSVGGLDSFTVRRWLQAFDPGVRIVVVIDSCFSRRWEDAMQDVADRVMTSTMEKVCAWSDLDWSWRGERLAAPDVNPQDRGTENTSSWVEALHVILSDPTRMARIEADAASSSQTPAEALLSQAYADGVLLDAAAMNGMTLPRSVDGIRSVNACAVDPRG